VTAPGIASIRVEDSIEALLVSHGIGSRAIYVAALVFSVGALIGTAVTSVDLTIRAQATLVPAIERQTLRSLSDGAVAQVRAAVGDRVRVGDTLITLAADAPERAYRAALIALEVQTQRRHDLSALLDASVGDSTMWKPPDLRLAQTKAAARATTVEWKQNTVQVMRAERTHDRQSRLMERGFATTADVEAAEFEVAKTREDRALALERRRSEWAADIATADQQIADLQRDVAARVGERAARYIIAPVSGTIEEIMALSAGSVVRAGDAMATVSPSGTLVADAIVAPRDVVYLKVGMPARLLVDGYDVQEWGAADAVIIAVAHDYTLTEGRPVFRVRVRPLRAELRRADGTRAQLGKGLHCQVRFLLGRKRLLQLLHERTGELLDPASPGDQ
jgi:multidrug resistance efflux pump